MTLVWLFRTQASTIDWELKKIEETALMVKKDRLKPNGTNHALEKNLRENSEGSQTKRKMIKQNGH